MAEADAVFRAGARNRPRSSRRFGTEEIDRQTRRPAEERSARSRRVTYASPRQLGPLKRMPAAPCKFSQLLLQLTPFVHVALGKACGNDHNAEPAFFAWLSRSTGITLAWGTTTPTRSGASGRSETLRHERDARDLFIVRIHGVDAHTVLRLQHRVQQAPAIAAALGVAPTIAMERGLSILWIDAICGSVQNSITPPENERGPSGWRSLRSTNGAAIGRHSRIIIG